MAGGFAPVVAAGFAVVVAAGVAAASVPHSALRKSFHFMPLSVPAVCAALYFALHSCIVSACADVLAIAAAPSNAVVHAARVIVLMSDLHVVALDLPPRTGAG